MSSEDYLNHKPLSLSVRFFHHSVLNFFTSCADSQASFSTFTYGLFFFLSFITHILVLNTDISTDLNVQLKSGNVYMIEIQGPGSFAARNPLDVFVYNFCAFPYFMRFFLETIVKIIIVSLRWKKFLKWKKWALKGLPYP